MVSFVGVVEITFKMLTVVSFDELIEEMFIINTTPLFCQRIGLIYLFDEIKCFATIRLG